ncbi:restriction endonuclease subunit S, partial [Mycoplasmopsis ciconiae]|nr:restriction endonuclease subunit S [Mycoplasmopsis ciconiae]
ESKPKIRFNNFTHAWEQHLVGDFLSKSELIRKDITQSSDIMTLGLNLTGLRIGRTRNKDIFENTKYFVRKSGQLIYGKQNIFRGSIALITDEFDGKCTSLDVPSLNINNIHKKFIYFILSNPDFYERTEKEAVGTGSKRVHEQILFIQKIITTDSYEEQTKIADLFTNLNSLITLHQRKLKKLE